MFTKMVQICGFSIEMCDSVTSTIDKCQFRSEIDILNPCFLQIKTVCKLRYTFNRQVISSRKESDRGW